MTQPILEAPGDVFLAAGDPERFLRDNLPSTPTDDTEEKNHHTAAIAIAGAFIAWRLYVLHQSKREPAPLTDPAGALHRLWRKHAPMWLRITAPVVSDVMAAQGLTGQELQAVAVDYATKLGEYIHETSSAAVVAGYREQLRKGVNPTLSWLRAMEGYGLGDRPLRSWLAQQIAVDGPISDLITPGARNALDRAILARADILGQTEAWQARQLAKSVVWMTDEANGHLPPGCRKRWITAHDEIVCPICGPLDQQEARLSDKFQLPNGKVLWAPGVHPNCRCELELLYPEVWFEKAMGKDPYNRNEDGEFATKESRRRKTVRAVPVKEREVDPDVQSLFDQMQDVPVAEAAKELIDPFASETTGIDPFAGGINPFAKPSIIDPLGTGGINPFPGTVDPFTKINPFEGKVDPFGAKIRPKTLTMLYIIRNGEVIPRPPDEDPDEEVDPQRLVMVSADDYYGSDAANLNSYRDADGELHVRPPDNKELSVGDVVDLSRTKTAGPLVGIEGLPVVSIWGPWDALTAAADSWYPDDEQFWETTQEYTIFMDDLEKSLRTLYTDISSNPDRILSEHVMSDRDIIDFSREIIPVEAKQANGDAKVLRSVLYEKVSSSQDVLDSLGEWAIIHNIGSADDVNATLDEISSKYGDDYIHVPQMFTFPKGYGVGDVDPGDIHPRIKGQYYVSRVLYHEVHADGPQRIRAWKEVQLEPLLKSGPTDPNNIQYGS